MTPDNDKLKKAAEEQLEGRASGAFGTIGSALAGDQSIAMSSLQHQQEQAAAAMRQMESLHLQQKAALANRFEVVTHETWTWGHRERKVEVVGRTAFVDRDGNLFFLDEEKNRTAGFPYGTWIRFGRLG